MTEFGPDDEAVAAIKRKLADYEAQRSVADRHRDILMPLSLAPALLVAVFGFVMIVSADEPPFGARDRWEFFFWVAIAVTLLASGGLWMARQPSKQLQQRLRDRLLPTLFGFVGDVEYAHGKTPLTFEHIPKGVLPGHGRTVFGDVLRGRHKWMRFELFEVELQTGGKNNRTVFDGVMVGFEIAVQFPGVLLATPRVGEWSMFFRDMFGTAFTTVEARDPLLDAAFEFRSDNSGPAQSLVRGPLGRALATVRDSWREGPPRIALSGTTGFLMVPTSRDFFELPDIGTSASYERHVEPMVTELLHLLDTALLVRRGMAGRDPSQDEAGLLD